ncbi:MAG: hypothetical protein IJR41_04880 [Atopobiaceae bacterium]|nr:hypothetical protein [Atopobiaceae bacterium]
MSDKISVTVDGIKVKVSRDAFCDFDNFELLLNADAGDAIAAIGFIRNVLGQKQFQRVKDEYRAAHGNLNFMDFLPFLKKLIEAVSAKANALKN